MIIYAKKKFEVIILKHDIFFSYLVSFMQHPLHFLVAQFFLFILKLSVYLYVYSLPIFFGLFSCGHRPKKIDLINYNRMKEYN